MNVAISLLMPKVQNVWVHAFAADMQCVFDDRGSGCSLTMVPM